MSRFREEFADKGLGFEGIWVEKFIAENCLPKKEVARVIEGMYLTFDQPSKFGDREKDGWYNHALDDLSKALGL